MPTYDYECPKCGEIKEVLHKMNDEPEILCPKCDKVKMKKLMSAPAIVFKGTGWYCTDNPSKSSIDGRLKDEKAQGKL
jgi:putative FmdB family regulatory protein